MSKSWKFGNEINKSVETLVTAYLATTHSTTFTIVYTDNNKLYSADLSTDEIYKLARTNGEKLMTHTATKQRIAEYSKKAIEFGTVEEINELAKAFPKANGGYLAEFLYRIKLTGETIETIKHSNNSKGYDVGSDTNDGRQIKCIDKGATFTSFKYLAEVCEKRNYNKLNEVKEAINTLYRIYKEEK